MSYQQEDLEWLQKKMQMSRIDYEKAQTVLKLISSYDYPKTTEFFRREIKVFQNPKSTLSANIKSLVLFRVIFSTGDYCAVNLVETFALPLLSNFIEVMNNSSKKRTPTYIQEEAQIGLAEMLNLQRIFIKFIYEFIDTSAKVKPFYSVYNSEIKHPSKFLLLAETLQANKNTLELQYFSPSYVSEIRRTYLQKLTRFKSQKYCEYFGNRICDQIEAGRLNQFNLVPMYESGDSYITQPVIHLCTEEFMGTVNGFGIKKKYLQLFAIAVENGFIESLLALEKGIFYQKLIQKVCAVEGQKGIDAGEQFHLQVIGTRKQRIDFYVSFLILLQRWAHTFPIDSQGNPSLMNRDYYHLKDSVHFVFPQDDHLEEYKSNTINNFKRNARRNRRIVEEEVQEKDSDKIISSFGDLLLKSQQIVPSKFSQQQIRQTIKQVSKSEEKLEENMAKLHGFQQLSIRRNQGDRNSECVDQLEKIKLLDQKYRMYKDGTIKFKQFSALATIVSEGRFDHNLLMATNHDQESPIGEEILQSGVKLTVSSPFKSKRKNSWCEVIKTNDLIENKMISSKVIRTSSEKDLIQKSKSYSDFSNLMKEKYAPSNFQEALLLDVSQPVLPQPINLIKTLPNKPFTSYSSKRVELGRSMDEEESEDKQVQPLSKQEIIHKLPENNFNGVNGVNYNPKQVYPTNEKNTKVIIKTQPFPVESVPTVQPSISPLINESGNNFDSLLFSKSGANMSQASNQIRESYDSNPEKLNLHLQSNVSQQSKFKGADLRVFKIFQNSRNSRSKDKIESQQKITSPTKRVLSPKLEKPTRLQNKTVGNKKLKGVRLLQPQLHASYFQNVDSSNLRAKKGLLRSKNLLFSSQELQIGLKDSVIGNRFDTTLFVTMLKENCFGVKISTVNYINLRFEYERNSFALLKRKEQYKFAIRSVVMAIPYEIPLFRLSYYGETSHKNHEIIFPLPIGFNKLCTFLLVPQSLPEKFEVNVVETPWFTRNSKLLNNSLAKETLFDFTELSSSKHEGVYCSKVNYENSRFLIRISLKKGLAQITGKSLNGQSNQQKDLAFLLATFRCMFEGDS